MEFHLGKLVQYFKLKRVGGAPKGYPFASQSIVIEPLYK
jgi:hypothetical protein